jgi:hypothetical protein
MNAEEAAGTSCNPLKNNKKGRAPPIRPITNNFNQSSLRSFANSFHSPRIRMNPDNPSAVRIFFPVVNNDESIPPTPYLLMNIEKPDTNAVRRMS